MTTFEFTSWCNEDYKKIILPKLVYVVQFFPELSNTTITVGYVSDTGLCNGYAYKPDMKIRLRKDVHLYTIAHEFTHLLQPPVPHGEKSCDVYTIARSSVYIDQQPSYIFTYQLESNQFLSKVEQLHELAKQAITKRSDGYRQYIKWFIKQARLLYDI